jgi:hypothetical protein
MFKKVHWSFLFALQPTPHPSSSCFAGTFSLREKDDHAAILLFPASASPNIQAAF